MRGRRLLLAVYAVLAMVGSANAQPASAEADTLFDQARTLMDEGKFAEACNAFDASQKLSPAVSTLFNQANCREKNQQYATAYGLWREAERQTRAPTDEQTEKMNRVAVERWKALEPRLSKLSITVPDPSRVDGLEIVRGTIVLEVGMWNRALPVDGGEYVITAKAPDRKPWSTTIVVGNERDTKSVEIPALELAPKAPEPVDTAPIVAARSRSKLPYIIAGGAVALLGGALVFELSSRSDYDASKREPDDAKQDDLYQSAKTSHYVAQGFAIAGIATLGVATYFYLRDRKDEPAPTQVGKLRVVPVITTERAGLQLGLSF